MDADEKQIRAIKFSDLLKKEFPPNPSYIEPSILPKGGTLLLGGLAKVGKSLVMMELMRALGTGKCLFENPSFPVYEPARCLYIEAENGERSVQDRGVKIFGAEDIKNYAQYLYVISKEPKLQLDTETGKAYFRQVVGDIKPNVLILDPISFMGNYDENEPRAVGRIFYTLAQFKKIHPASNMSVVISHHFGKPPKGQYAQSHDPLDEYNFRGASKWKDAPDSIITMHRIEELTRPWEAWKLRCRFLLRHDSSPPEVDLLVNDLGDLRVKWKNDRGKLRPIKIVEKEEKKNTAAAGEQKTLVFQVPKKD